MRQMIADLPGAYGGDLCLSVKFHAVTAPQNWLMGADS